MPDKDSKTDPFKPQQPRIPGVSYSEPAEKAASPAPPRRLKSALIQAPPTWIILALTGALILGGAIAWWSHSSSAKEPVSLPEAEPVGQVAEPAKPAEKMAIAPGAVANLDELAKPWSSKRFIFRESATGRDTPAIVVHLPDGTNWGLSLQEPFGSCEMEYVTDLQKLETVYHYRAAHPMVGDPCSKTVFDLTRYGTAPGGLVRGEIAQGAGVRPPIAIEIETRGKQVLAVRMEQF
jgi:hypothetical protein